MTTVEVGRLLAGPDQEPGITDPPEELREAARRIDPRTARMEWCWAEVADPYGLTEVRPYGSCVKRQYFLIDPVENVRVLDSDVRRAHYDIPDYEWDYLMRAAAVRGEGSDPLPWFHWYRNRRVPDPPSINREIQFVDDPWCPWAPR